MISKIPGVIFRLLTYSVPVSNTMNYLNRPEEQHELATSFVLDHPHHFLTGDFIAVDPFGHCTIDRSADKIPLESYLLGTILFPVYRLLQQVEEKLEDELYSNYLQTA